MSFIGLYKMEEEFIIDILNKTSKIVECYNIEKESNREQFNIFDANVFTEYYTDKNRRIDIVINA